MHHFHVAFFCLRQCMESENVYIYKKSNEFQVICLQQSYYISVKQSLQVD